MTGGADAAVVNLLHAARSTLRNDLGGEIDFVMRRTNAGTELHDQILRDRTESLRHQIYRARNNFQLSALLAGMHEADRRCFWIDNKNGAAISDINAETNFPLIGDESVAAGEAIAGSDRSINDRYFIPVNLFGREKGKCFELERLFDLAMNGVESRERFRFVTRDFNPGNAPDECVPANGIERRKFFDDVMSILQTGNFGSSSATRPVAGRDGRSKSGASAWVRAWAFCQS
ncbi:MAG: hypothetical protein QOI04_1918 [Verrucomicrobiota bacterium]